MPNRQHIKIALGFDFGMKRIGVAVGQTLTATAEPLGVISAKDGVPDWNLIQTLIENWNPVTLIVGIPYNMDGSSQKITHEALKFSQALQRFGLPVHTVDERLSTVAAKSLLLEQKNIKKTKLKERLDSQAAKLILEQWLQDHFNSSN